MKNMKLTTKADALFLAAEWLGDSTWDDRETDERLFSEYLWTNFAGRDRSSISDAIGTADEMFALIENLKNTI